MPAKNSIKQYLENGYYHIYNRGVEKRIIFLDQQDYAVFLSYLKEYLLPKKEKELHDRLADPQISSTERNKIIIRLKLNNFSGEITLLAYCLMPNHFHFFIKQKSVGAIDSFMNSLATRYTMYFNRKYKRVGHLYQGVYKAVLIVSEPQFLHLSRYIHRQALASPGSVRHLASQAFGSEAVAQARRGEVLREKQPCSYPEYLGQRKTKWIHPEEILAYFDKENSNLSYENFVKQNDEGRLLQKLTLEED
ncbi:MAG: Tnp protein [Candidatus Levybacteria bacterium]|nr:Tnp protein [Candidatus Levybacteria bacterium]